MCWSNMAINASITLSLVPSFYTNGIYPSIYISHGLISLPNWAYFLYKKISFPLSSLVSALFSAPSSYPNPRHHQEGRISPWGEDRAECKDLNTARGRDFAGGKDQSLPPSLVLSNAVYLPLAQILIPPGRRDFAKGEDLNTTKRQGFLRGARGPKHCPRCRDFARARISVGAQGYVRTSIESTNVYVTKI